VSKPREHPLRLVVLISGGGRSLENLHEVIQRGELDAEIPLVISSRREVQGVERCQRLGLRCAVLRPRDFASREAWAARVWNEIRSVDAELVCLMGFLSLLPIPEDWRGRVLNIHPALLPKFGGQGMFGEHVHRAVLEAGEQESGCTVHWCDDEYDRGEIVLQRRCPVEPGDTPDTLAARVFAEELRAYPEAIRLVAEA
jgi:phosphoribosylglycinamide formyltransferase-1